VADCARRWSLGGLLRGRFVPGLLQTVDYMRAVVGGGQLGDLAEEAEHRVQLRLGRRALLGRERVPRLWAVVDEATLRRPVGGAKVMRVSWSG
jgi:Domain of unknown function (DUF5753)